MIQRIQSLWLLLASAAGIATYQLPLWSGKLQDGTTKVFLGTESLFFFALTVGLTTSALISIFLFSNRTLQRRMALSGWILSLLLISLEFYFVDAYKTSLNFQQSSWQFGALMPMLMAIFFFLAWQGIRHDERLVKDSGRLR